MAPVMITEVDNNNQGVGTGDDSYATVAYDLTNLA